MTQRLSCKTGKKLWHWWHGHLWKGSEVCEKTSFLVLQLQGKGTDLHLEGAWRPNESFWLFFWRNWWVSCFPSDLPVFASSSFLNILSTHCILTQRSYLCSLETGTKAVIGIVQLEQVVLHCQKTFIMMLSLMWRHKEHSFLYVSFGASGGKIELQEDQIETLKDKLVCQAI